MRRRSRAAVPPQQGRCRTSAPWNTPARQRQQFLRKRGIYLLPQRVHHGGALLRLLRRRSGDERALRDRGHRHFRRDGASTDTDGRVARMTHTQSALGEQFDSLLGYGSFGVRARLVMYGMGAEGPGRWGWLAAFVYCSGAAPAARALQRERRRGRRRYFQGLRLRERRGGALIAGFRLARRPITACRSSSCGCMWSPSR